MNTYPKPFASFKAALAWRHTSKAMYAFSCHYYNFGHLTKLQFFDRDSRWLWVTGETE
jgi:hypothetical protein